MQVDLGGFIAKPSRPKTSFDQTLPACRVGLAMRLVLSLLGFVPQPKRHFNLFGSNSPLLGALRAKLVLGRASGL